MTELRLSYDLALDSGTALSQGDTSDNAKHCYKVQDAARFCVEQCANRHGSDTLKAQNDRSQTSTEAAHTECHQALPNEVSKQTKRDNAKPTCE
jgi:hypothetical protein